MISHVYVGVNDFERAFKFYSAVVSELGHKLKFCEPEASWAGWMAEGMPRPRNSKAQRRGKAVLPAVSISAVAEKGACAEAGAKIAAKQLRALRRATAISTGSARNVSA